MATSGPGAPPLTHHEKKRLLVLLQSVSSRTLLKVLRDMEKENTDASLIAEVLLERMVRGELAAVPQAPVMPT